MIVGENETKRTGSYENREDPVAIPYSCILRAHLCIAQGGTRACKRTRLLVRASRTRASLLARANGRTRARSEGALLRNVNGCALAHRRCRRSTPMLCTLV